MAAPTTSLNIPTETTVLVIGGGPAGSYAACALAREGIKTTVLEADIFPRYHVGESMLASLRPFLHFVDLDKTFREHGFTKKTGAAFKLNQSKREGFTDFTAVGGKEGYAWNVVRSESDDLIFRHAGKSGASIHDGVKVESIDFSQPSGFTIPENHKTADLGRPTSATWKRKDGTTGVIKFDYLVDASGRQGIVSTKYMKNRVFNQGLKNVANWGYWKGAGKYGTGTSRENVPLFEALTDASGWAWLIPLHNGTTSVGVVMRQDLSVQKKKALGSPTGVEFYKESLKLAPSITKLIGDGQLTTEVKGASDWSYNAPEYASPYVRIAGDAGCFIDPYFSSGVHLAIASGLSAALTICASRNNTIPEIDACKWHSTKVAEGYTRFLVVVMSAMKQIRGGDEPVLSDFDDDGFDQAFDAFRPVIQGTADADVSGKLTQSEVVKTVDFCLQAFKEITPEERERVLAKVKAINGTTSIDRKEDLEKLSEADLKILETLRAKQMLRMEDGVDIDHFKGDAINGFAPNVKHGSLGLVPKSSKTATEKLELPIKDVFIQVEDPELVPVAA